MRLFAHRAPLAEARWLVIDCETSGLDPARDRLLSVGAVRVSGERLQLAECFSSHVRPSLPSAASNILVHGIGADAQLAAPQVAEVLPQLARFIEGHVPVAFHAWFDRQVLEHAGLRVARRWLDLEPLARELMPHKTCRTLDDWLAACHIGSAGRHDALYDALAAAELLLVLLARARSKGMRTVEELLSAAGKIPL